MKENLQNTVLIWLSNNNQKYGKQYKFNNFNLNINTIALINTGCLNLFASYRSDTEHLGLSHTYGFIKLPSTTEGNLY